MFRSKKVDKSKSQAQKRSTGEHAFKPKTNIGQGLAQFGLLDVADMDHLNIDDDEDDEDLEAELFALTRGIEHKVSKPKVSSDGLDKMVAECMQDDDADDAVDENDPELLAELSALGFFDEEISLSNAVHSSEPGQSCGPSVDRPQTAPPIPPKPSAQTAKPPASAPMIVRPSPMVAGSNLMQLLVDRVAMYEQAEGKALADGDTMKARRFTRGLKTLRQMLQSARNGLPVNEGDIPPVVSFGSNPPSLAPTPPPPEDSPVLEGNPMAAAAAIHSPSRDLLSPDVPHWKPEAVIMNVCEELPLERNAQNVLQEINNSLDMTNSNELISTLNTRLGVYKAAAISAKRCGDKETALNYMRVAKQLEAVVAAAAAGQAVDIMMMPEQLVMEPNIVQPHVDLRLASPRESLTPPRTISVPVASTDCTQDNSQPNSSNIPPTPTTVMEALEQRLSKYMEMKDKAKVEGDSRKERQNQRIIKQYQDAIREHKLGKWVNFEELPKPAFFAPIPGIGSTTPTVPPSTASTTDPLTMVNPVTSLNPPRLPPTEGGPSPPKQLKPDNVEEKKSSPIPPKHNVRTNPKSRVERQISLLTTRQKQFRDAAIEAKRKGEMEQAKEYLRTSKGFDQLIEASVGGLPVDMNTVPVPPQEQLSTNDLSFEVVTYDDCHAPATGVCGDNAVLYAKLEEDLIGQIKMCAQTREHFKAVGDVASANRFEQLIVHTKKDLDAVRAAFKRGDPLPRFHYESRTFNMVQCNTDLNDSDCEVAIICGTNYNVSNPKEIDTYIRIDFPYPSDNPPFDRTVVVKDTNCPEYNHKSVFSIDRKSRALSRVFKRNAIKLSVFGKGHWFKSDNMIGTVKIPLVSLETKCSLHESYDLMDERKKMVGGKVEVKVRVRNPILAKQLEKVTHKWLVIDGF